MKPAPRQRWHRPKLSDPASTPETPALEVLRLGEPVDFSGGPEDLIGAQMLVLEPQVPVGLPVFIVRAEWPVADAELVPAIRAKRVVR